MVDAHLVPHRLQPVFVWKLAIKEDKWRTWTAFAAILNGKTVIDLII